MRHTASVLPGVQAHVVLTVHEVYLNLQSKESHTEVKAGHWKGLFEEVREKYAAAQDRIDTVEARLAKLEGLLWASIAHKLDKTSAEASPCDN